MKNYWRPLVTIVLLAVAVGVWVLNWSRLPDSGLQVSRSQRSPAVTQVRVIEPGSEGAPYRVEAVVSPEGASGPIDVAIGLRNKATGEVTRMSGQVTLTPGTALVVVAPIHVPRGDYEPQVDLRSSPR
jgi:hypothetical protein